MMLWASAAGHSHGPCAVDFTHSSFCLFFFPSVAQWSSVLLDFQHCSNITFKQQETLQNQSSPSSDCFPVVFACVSYTVWIPMKSASAASDFFPVWQFHVSATLDVCHLQFLSVQFTPYTQMEAIQARINCFQCSFLLLLPFCDF